jgi:glyoxylase-like metal-dependent hydrolase (beta-lactamase superfamily II)
MEINPLVLGLYETSCYVLRKDTTQSECVVIDTGLDADGMVEYLAAKKLEPAAIILTHGHADHIGGVAKVKGKYSDARIYIHQADASMLTNRQDNLSSFAGVMIEAPEADVQVKDGDIIEEAQIKLTVIHTPGHTPGGMSLLCRDEAVVFTGDTLFADSVGRSDFPGGSMPRLIESIKTRLFVLPDETVVYPGHGPKTNIGHEKKHNPFVK